MPSPALSRFVLLTLSTLLFAACGTDTVGGAAVNVTGNGAPVVGGVCNPNSDLGACVGHAALQCTPAGTWVIKATCGTGQTCQQANSSAPAFCAKADADAGGDLGTNFDAGTGSDAELPDAGPVDDAGPIDDAQQQDGTTVGGCATYQDVQALFQNNCNGCHNHKFGDGCNMAANYPLIAARVKDGTMPPGGGLGASDKALVAAWAAGKNVCTPDKCPGADAGSTWDVGPDAIDDTVGPGPDVLADSITIPDSGSTGDTGAPSCVGYPTVKQVFANNCSGGGCHSFQNTCPAPGGKFGSTAIGNSVAAGTMPPGGGMSASDQSAIAAWVSGGAVCNCPIVTPDAGSTDTGTSDAGTTDAGTTPPPATCGNLQCNAGENAANCPIDCGAENTCILANCGQQANTCMNSTNCSAAFLCDQTCAVGDAACIAACVAGKSNKTKNNLNALNNCIAANQCASGGTTPSGNVCDAACGNQGGVVNGKACYCDAQCGTYGDCCNATATAVGQTCGGSTCGQCNGGVTPPVTCGNGACDAGETTATCPADCPAVPAVCGNGTCEAGETNATCPADCPVKMCTVYTDVQAILKNNCNGCHGHQFGNSCAATAGHDIAGWVANGSMPTNKTLSAADKAKIASWAATGNACTLAQCP